MEPSSDGSVAPSVASANSVVLDRSMPATMPAVRRPPSTLLTSPITFADFMVRLVFFAVAPFAIVLVAAFFPVGGALANIAIALLATLLAEAIRARVVSFPRLSRFVTRRLQMDAYYRGRKPRPFLYYVFYPLFFPYWLLKADARREFWLFKGYTLTSFAILVVSVIYQYFTNWQPELGIKSYLPLVGLTLAVETILVLSLLMPIVTTVIWFHQSFRRGRLVILLVVGLLSTGAALARIAQRRDPIVSYDARERVRLRTAAAPWRAKEAQLDALRAAWKLVRTKPNTIEEDGKIEGDPLDAAHTALEKIYKPDETFAFDLWANKKREILVLYFDARGKKSRQGSSWTAMKRSGEEVTDANKLPGGAEAWSAMRRAAKE